MEVYTCEGYVLARLEEAMGRNEQLANEVGRLEAQLQLAEEARGEFALKLEEYGRGLLFKAVTMCQFVTGRGDSEPMAYEDWKDFVTLTATLPEGFARDEVMRGLEPEYLEAYEGYIANFGRDGE